jgi:hypothetical protein
MAFSLSDRIQEYLRICELHVDRLKWALGQAEQFSPLTPEIFDRLDYRQLAVWDFIVNRFSKLQDCIGSKIFPLVLSLTEENVDSMTTLDRMHKLEKIGFLPSSQVWKKIRDVRNHVTHEYPEKTDSLIAGFNDLIEYSFVLIGYFEKMKSEISRIQDQIDASNELEGSS